jgi:hypothetical protein
MATFDFVSQESSGGRIKRKLIASKDNVVDFNAIRVGTGPTYIQIGESSGHFTFESKRLTSVADPAAGTDAANRQWVLSQLTADLVNVTNTVLSDSTKFLMVADASITSAASGLFYAEAGAVIGGFSGLSVNQPVYASRSTNGGYAVDTTGFVSGEGVFRIGFALDANNVEFDPAYLFHY